MNHHPRLAGSIMRQAPAPVQMREEELDLTGIIRLFRRRIRLIGSVTAALTVLAIPAILSMDREYYGASRVLIQRPLTATLGQAEKDLPLDLNTETQRLSSRDVAARVITEFELANRDEFNPALRKDPFLRGMLSGLRSFVTGDEPARPAANDPLDTIIPEFLSALSVQRDVTSSVIEVGFKSQDPSLAAQIPNAVVRIYLDDRDRKLKSRVEAARVWVADRILEQRERVATANRAIKEFRETAGLVSSNAQADAIGAISTLSAGRAELATSRAEVAAALGELQASKGRPDEFNSVDSEGMSDLRRELRAKQQRLETLLATFGDSHPEVISARASIQQIEASMATEAEEYARSLNSRLAALDREEQALLEGLDSARNTLSRLSLVDADLANLLRGADTEKKSLDDLERQRQALEAQAGLPVANAEVLSPATVPQGPLGRPRSTYLLGALFLAALIGVTVACIREMFDRSLRSSQQLEGLVGIQPVGMLPRLPDYGTKALPDLLWQERAGIFADAMRGLVLAIQRSNAGNLPRSLAITSAFPNEGKSVTATALALTLAANGWRVLLVDCDWRRGRVHELFGVGASPGLAEFLQGDCQLEDVIRVDDTDGLDYIARGALKYTICHQQRSAEIIEYAREHDQVVIFDCPPVLATAETSLLAGLAERTLLVMRWGKSQRRHLDLAVHRLIENSEEDILTVLAMVDPQRHALYGFKDSGLFTGELKRYYA